MQEVPTENMVLLVGPPGSGKSTFCQQAVLQNLILDRPIIYVTTKYGPPKVESFLRQRGLRGVEPGFLCFVDAYNNTVGVSVSERPDTTYADCNDLSSIDIAILKLSERIGRSGVLLVFDSLTSPYLFNGSVILRFMTQTLSRFAARGNAVIACMDEGCGKSEDIAAMMSLSNGVIRTETQKDKLLFDIVKHPKETPARIEISMGPRRAGVTRLLDIENTDPQMTGKLLVAMMGGDEAALRPGVGDFVNLFWPNLVHWSGMLWDPKGFPTMKYELNREDETEAQDLFPFFPWTWRIFIKTFQTLWMPRDFCKVKSMKRIVSKHFIGQLIRQERSGILEYLEDSSKDDEHYIRAYENVDCWGFENVGAGMGLYLPSIIAGKLKGLDREKREWNAVETKCVGLGDPYCEFKVVPGEIEELKRSLEKDSSVVERVHQQVMQRLMGFLIEGKPLIERPSLGSDVHFHVVWHVMGFPYLAGERYQMALRMGGAKAGKEVGEHLMDAGLGEDEAVKRILHLLEYCKVGKVSMDERLKIKENIESSCTLTLKRRLEEPSCFFTTGFLNGFFWAVKNQHVKETRCIAMGDPYCEWEFR